MLGVSVKIFVMGATGSIGSTVARELLAHGHQVIALARSDSAAARVRALGGEPLMGDLTVPHAWASIARTVDAIIQVAATFEEDMGTVDRRVLEALADEADLSAAHPQFVYTGGCWLYGATGDMVADEATPLRPISAFEWMVENAAYLTERGSFSTAFVHPAMVYHQEGGVFARYLESARNGGPLEIWGSAEARWPLVHRDDLAVAYRLLAENGDLTGSFNISAETGVATGAIAATIAQRYGIGEPPVVRTRESAVAEHGDWAEGPTLDQQMGSKRARDVLGWTPVHTDYRDSDLP